MTKGGYVRFRELMERGRVSKIEGEGTMQETYDKMVTEVMGKTCKAKTCQTKLKHKKEKTPIRQLMRKKKIKERGAGKEQDKNKADKQAHNEQKKESIQGENRKNN